MCGTDLDLLPIVEVDSEAADDRKALQDGLIAMVEHRNRPAHEPMHFTYELDNVAGTHVEEVRIGHRAGDRHVNLDTVKAAFADARECEGLLVTRAIPVFAALAPQ
jgi:hypothetical protein